MRGTSRLGWLALVAVAVAAFSGWALAPAFSSSLDPMLKAKGLTKAKAKKLFYTKNASDQRYYPKADSDARYYSKADSDARYYSKSESDGRYYSKAESDANFLSASGATALQASPLTWEQTVGASGASAHKGSDGIFLNSGVVTTAVVAIGPTLPTVLSGRPMELVGVNACYATPTATTVTQVSIYVSKNTSGSTNTTNLLADTTPRTDNACRDYTLPTPVALAPDEYVTLEMYVDFPGGGGQSFSANRATFYIEPQ